MTVGVKTSGSDESEGRIRTGDLLLDGRASRRRVQRASEREDFLHEGKRESWTDAPSHTCQSPG